MEADLANARRQVPAHPPELLGELPQDRPAVERQPRPRQPGKRGNELRERRIAGDGQPLGPPVEPEDRVPAAIGGEVPGEHEESVGGLLRPIEKPQHPYLRVEDVARPRAPHLADDVLEQRH